LAQVPITIAGRTYRMACAEGEEAHLEGLAAELEADSLAGLALEPEKGLTRSAPRADPLRQAREVVRERGMLTFDQLRLQAANATVEQTVGHWAIEATAAIEAAAARLEQTVQTLNGAGRTEG